MFLPHPQVLSEIAETRLETIRRQISSSGERPRLRRRAGAWLVRVGFKLAPELRPSR
jgi:hypothetical protein